MIDHLAAIGWPYLVLGLLLLFGGVADFVWAGVVAWVRHERELARRARAYNQRVEAAREVRVRW